MMQDVVKLENVSKVYALSGNRIRALDGMNFSLPTGTMAAVVGPSGSGKSTLLNIIGALDHPDSGNVVIQGKRLDGLSEADLTVHRRKTVGFIFQDYGLIPNLTALENVMLPMEFARVSRPKARERARALLEAVEMGARTAHRPNKLSGGEQQRVAIARALANDPAIILADEPTGNLDTVTGKGVVSLLRRLADEQHKTVIVVTHDETVAQSADMRFHIKDGRIMETN
jgi:putative ABC transport system ATP-binding protein